MLLECWVVPTEPDMVTGVDAERRDVLLEVNWAQDCDLIFLQRRLHFTLQTGFVSALHGVD